jgi:hypothetical protein
LKAAGRCNQAGEAECLRVARQAILTGVVLHVVYICCGDFTTYFGDKGLPG